MYNSLQPNTGVKPACAAAERCGTRYRMSEAAKRARLERLVRPLKRAVCWWIRRAIKSRESKDLSPSGGITGLSYAEAWAEMAQAKRGFQAEPTKFALCLITIFCGLTQVIGRRRSLSGKEHIWSALPESPVWPEPSRPKLRHTSHP